MFRCLAHQLFGSPDRHYDVRSLLVRFETKNAPLLMAINSPDFASHIRELLKPTKWGTHVELLAASTYPL